MANDLPSHWLLLNNIPRSIAGREIDVLALSVQGAVVIELKQKRGRVFLARKSGAWLCDEQPWTDDLGSDVNPIEQAEEASQSFKRAFVRKFPDYKFKPRIDACGILTTAGAKLTYFSPDVTECADLLDNATWLLERRVKIGQEGDIERGTRPLTVEQLTKILELCEVSVDAPDLLSNLPFQTWLAESRRSERRPSQARQSTARRSPSTPAQPAPKISTARPLPKRPPVAPRQPPPPPTPPPPKGRLVWMIAILFLGGMAYGLTRCDSPSTESLTEVRSFYVAPASGVQSINVRSAPGVSSRIVGELARGTAVRSDLERQAPDGTKWRRVFWRNSQGYVKADLLSETGSPLTDIIDVSPRPNSPPVSPAETPRSARQDNRRPVAPLRSAERRSSPAPARSAVQEPGPETIVCILPGGATARTSEDACYAQAGVVYR